MIWDVYPGLRIRIFFPTRIQKVIKAPDPQHCYITCSILIQEGGDEPVCDIDEILKRAETRTEEQVDEGDGLLAAFKVASFAVDEDEAVQSAAKENGGVKVPYSVIMSSIILLKDVYVAEFFFTQSEPVWVDDLGIGN